MGKYHNWLNTALGRLVEDFLGGDFKPQNESDIKCHLYHTLLQTKSQIKSLTSSHLVLSEFSIPTSQERVDLAIVRKKKMNGEPRLLVEIKETKRDHLTADEVEERIKGDIDKLRKYKKMLEEERKSIITKYFKTPVIVFFFRGAGKHGVAVKTDRALNRLQKNYDDIILWWGPR